MNNECKKIIVDYVREHGESDRDFLSQLIADKIKYPSKEALIKRYVWSKISNIIADVRDNNGNRSIVANRNKNSTQYINIDKCEHEPTLDNVQDRLKTDIESRQITLDTVREKIALLQARQLSGENHETNKA